MMATAGPPNASGLLPLLETLGDDGAGQAEQTDAYLTIASRISGDEGRQFLPAVEKHFALLGKCILGHISSSSPELSQAALQALGFCVYYSHVASRLSESFAAEILSALCSLVVKSTDKNTCTRALWVISKQSFPAGVVAKQVSTILASVECVWVREDVQSVIMEHEALNVIIRLLEQVPASMADGAVRWAELVVPLVVHSASKVRLRAAAALEMGMPLLLQKQTEVAAVIEPMMSTKLIPELQKLFLSKNEANVLKLWPLFIKLLGKLLHRGGPFINSLLHLEELGFRSSSASVKKIAFIAWKSLIDNFALNPDILCSAKRMKLLMQPLSSIHVRTEALLLTKVEVWWYLVVQLGPHLSSNFDQVSVPLLQCSLGFDSSPVPATPSRSAVSNGAAAPGTPKSGLGSPGNLYVMSVNGGVRSPCSFPSIQLLGLEMLLHYFLGPEATTAAAKNKLSLSLEPLSHQLLSGASSFSKHAAVLLSGVRDAFSSVGKEAAESLLTVIWTSLLRFVCLAIESAGGGKRERQGCEALPLTLQALQGVVSSERLPADKVLALLEATVKVLPAKVLGSASYQVGKMDVLNGTPALFLILLLYDSSLLPSLVLHDRFFHCLQTLVGCGLSGPASPLAFAEAVLAAVNRSAPQLHDKEVLWRMWSVVVSPLTDTITQSNEVNQGDALEHNFSAVHSALMFPVTQLIQGARLRQASQKSTLASWSKLYRVFARCSALVVTAEENICCEELSAKMAAAIDGEALSVPSTASAVACMLQVMVECVDFSPYTSHFQQKLKSPRTPVGWMRKKSRALGNLSSFLSLLVRCLHVYLEAPDAFDDVAALLAVLSALFTHLALAEAVRETLVRLVPPLARLYGEVGGPNGGAGEFEKEKLLLEVLGCLQTRAALAFDSELLALLSPLLLVVFPHENKQMRSGATHFWNATFANSAGLSYPDEMRPVLLQVKHKTPIILPGFQVSEVPDEPGGPDASENSQLETKLSGFSIASLAPKDCAVSASAPKPLSTKLDFGSPKPPSRDILEEDASVDFVFIPPEAKERVLTEHQKEMKRTKRVDIPAMYNNLDASQDTTAFSQYSQDDWLDKAAPGRESTGDSSAWLRDAPRPGASPASVPQKEVELHKVSEVLTEETKDFRDEDRKMAACEKRVVVLHSADISVQEDAESTPAESRENSLNMTGSSDLVSGTPQKHNSRRQSFITLEKYSEGKSSSPSAVSSFTGPLVKVSNSPKQSCKTSSPEVSSSEPSSRPHSQSSPTTKFQKSAFDLPESPRRPKASLGRTEPLRLTERLSSGTTEDEDVIPDTQAKDATFTAPLVAEQIVSSSQDEKPDEELEDSQSSVTESPSGVSRLKSPGDQPLVPGDQPLVPGDQPLVPGDQPLVPGDQPLVPGDQPLVPGDQPLVPGDQPLVPGDQPLVPGDDPNTENAKLTHFKRRKTQEEHQIDSVQSRRSTRSQQAAEERSRTIRTRSKRDEWLLGQNSSQEKRRKRIGLLNNSEDFLGNLERKRKSSSGLDSSQVENESQSSKRRGRPSKAGKQESDSAQQLKNLAEPRTDSQDATPSTDLSQESEPGVKVSPCSTSTSSDDTGSITDALNEILIHTTQTGQGTDEPPSQEDPGVLSPTSESQTQRRSRRSKTTPEATEDHAKGSQKRETRSHFQVEVQSAGRATRRKSAPALGASLNSSRTESSKKSKRPRASLQTPLPVVSKEPSDDEDDNASQNAQSVEPVVLSTPGDSPNLEVLQGPQRAENESRMTKAVSEDGPLEGDGPPMEGGSESPDCQSSIKTEQRDSGTSIGTSSHGDSEPGASEQQTHHEVSEEPAADVDSLPQSDNTEKTAVESQPEMDSGAEAAQIPTADQKETDPERGRVLDEDHELSKSSAHQEVFSGLENDQDLSKDRSENLEPTSPNKDLDLASNAAPGVHSPLKQEDQSPGGGRTRGTWSPSASPSTSILKKRQLEADSPSPLVKSRRVSFADPIQRQETADDIDRRSPAVRTSSPRRPKAGGNPSAKLVTTPTKSPLILSPRNLHSPGYKSSKKCLISEMSREPRPVSRHCVYPPLVGCSAPVEAVLPQISSNMWSRGFGQLVRARNIKTVGDLSALTPTEVKALPIRSPKISNVKKALQTYEQQRKGRSGDELKSFDETERMTSEVEEGGAAAYAEDEKTPGDAFAAELLDEMAAEQQGASLLSELQALTDRMSPAELSRCSPRDLVNVHELLGGLMRDVVVELETRIGHMEV